MNLAQLRDPQRAVGKTIAEVFESGWRHEVRFTDGTKLQIGPGANIWIDDADPTVEDPAVELIFQDDPSAD